MKSRTLIKDIANSHTALWLAGRVYSVRKMKTFCFFDIIDKSGKMQAAIDNNTALRVPNVGDIVAVRGVPFKTKTGQLSIKCEKIELLSESCEDVSNALSNQSTSDEQSVRSKRSLELIVDDRLRTMIVARSLFIDIVRAKMKEGGFLEVDTPVLSPLRFAGTADVFETESKGLDRTLFLRGTLEDYLKQLVVAGMEKVFQIGDCFRNESPALVEFTMLEATWAYGTSKEMLKHVTNIISDVCKRMPDELVDPNAKKELSKKFEIVSFWEILNEYFQRDIRDLPTAEIRKIAKLNGYTFHNLDKDFEYEIAKFGYDVIKRTLSKQFKSPTFVGRFPACISPLAMEINDGNREADRGYGFFRGQRLFEVVAEANDYREQLRKFEDQDSRNPLPNYSFKNDDLLESLRYGCPPMAGLGFNINRILAVLLNKSRTSDVLAFPITSASLPL